MRGLALLILALHASVQASQSPLVGRVRQCADYGAVVEVFALARDRGIALEDMKQAVFDTPRSEAARSLSLRTLQIVYIKHSTVPAAELAAAAMSACMDNHI